MTHAELNLTDEQRELLVQILTNELKKKQVEEHRTDSLEFKQFVANQEKLIEAVLNKLENVAVA